MTTCNRHQAGFRLARAAIAAAIALGLAAISGGAVMANPTDPQQSPASAAPPKVELETSKGTIVIELAPGAAPESVENFLGYVDDGFYDGLIFHRVIAGFVIQGGGYDGEMTYRQPRGTVANESHNGLRNDRGTIAMARLSDPDSASSQFYFNVADNHHLNAQPAQPGYTVFGRVVDGMEVLDRIELVDTTVRAGMPGVPETPVVIERARRLP
jgi:cyclophilin family peptidyl-prolyl cis-trans isomerase